MICNATTIFNQSFLLFYFFFILLSLFSNLFIFHVRRLNCICYFVACVCVSLCLFIVLFSSLFVLTNVQVQLHFQQILFYMQICFFGHSNFFLVFFSWIENRVKTRWKKIVPDSLKNRCFNMFFYVINLFIYAWITMSFFFFFLLFIVELYFFLFQLRAESYVHTNLQCRLYYATIQ